jgi:phosphatidylserine/phosphatidylglycerophosphate/cardiolipin synthase-like enzyme
VLAGCQTSAAHFTDPDGEAPAPPRAVVLARQVLRDTADEIGRHPLRSSEECLSEFLDHLGAAGQGLICKRLGLCLPAGRSSSSDPSCPSRYCLPDTRPQPADVRLYLDGGAALAELKRLIQGATCRIDVLMFEWDSDPLGTEIASWLARQAGPHLPVRVLVDGGGNLMFGHPLESSATQLNRVVCWLAQQPYVEVVRVRNPFARFDHRKLVVVDGCCAWSGGRNFTYEGFFVDHDVTFTVTGPLVAELEECFELCWQDQGCLSERVTEWESARVRECESEGVEDLERDSAGDCSSTLPLSHSPTLSLSHALTLPRSHAPTLSPNAWACVVHTRPCAPRLARTVYRAVEQARDHVYVENYGLCDSRLVCRLIAAQRHGADVRVVLPRASYTHTMTCANRVAVNRLLHAGVRVYLYPGATHVKAAAVDGCWAYIGTGNYDALSMRHNREVGLAVSGGPLIQELEERLFVQDFRPEWEVKEPLCLSFSDYLYELVASLVM